MTQLAEAQAKRRARVAQSADAQLEALLNRVGLSEDEVSRLSEADSNLSTANVSPADRQKLKGIINRLRTKQHPFTTCMADLREHKPDWSEDRRKKTCAVLKQLTGRGNNGTAKHSEESICVMLTDGVAALLEQIDEEVLEIALSDSSLAELTAQKRKSMPKSSFVFPKQKRYPFHDRAHAANALARSKGKPEEATVRATVCKRFSDLPACQKKAAA